MQHQAICRWPQRHEKLEHRAWHAAQVAQEEYNTFFTTTFREFLEPLAQTHFNVEGTIEFSALLFVPGMAPFEQQVRPPPSVRGRTSEPLAEGSATWQNSWQNAFHFVT